MWIDKGLKTIYFFHHQPENLLAPDMTSYFVHQLNEMGPWKWKVPQKHIDQQMTLF